MPGNKKWIKTNEWRRQQTKIKMDIELVRFACMSVVDRIWKLKCGARVFCMPYEMIKAEGFGNSFIKEGSLFLEHRMKCQRESRRVEDTHIHTECLIVGEWFVVQTIGGFFMFSFFLRSFFLLFYLMPHENAFHTIWKNGKSKKHSTIACALSICMNVCLMLYVFVYFSDCR